MSPSLAERLDAVPRKNLAAGSVTDRKPLAEDWNRVIGQAIERGILLARLEKKDVACRMGYSDQSALSRWIGGTETAQLPKLFAIAELREPLTVALAEVAGAEIHTEIRFSRRAA